MTTDGYASTSLHSIQVVWTWTWSWQQIRSHYTSNWWADLDWWPIVDSDIAVLSRSWCGCISPIVPVCSADADSWTLSTSPTIGEIILAWARSLRWMQCTSIVVFTWKSYSAVSVLIKKVLHFVLAGCNSHKSYVLESIMDVVFVVIVKIRIVVQLRKVDSDCKCLDQGWDLSNRDPSWMSQSSLLAVDQFHHSFDSCRRQDQACCPCLCYCI